jgi:extradiol dioxygenase family protein
MNPFHLAIHVRDIAEARDFYLNIMGCTEGRSDQKWVDFNFYGHQLVCHLNPVLSQENKVAAIKNPVDGHGVPVPHFGKRWP